MDKFSIHRKIYSGQFDIILGKAKNNSIQIITDKINSAKNKSNNINILIGIFDMNKEYGNTSRILYYFIKSYTINEYHEYSFFHVSNKIISTKDAILIYLPGTFTYIESTLYIDLYDYTLHLCNYYNPMKGNKNNKLYNRNDCFVRVINWAYSQITINTNKNYRIDMTTNDGIARGKDRPNFCKKYVLSSIQDDVI